MSWLYETLDVSSERSGPIHCRRLFGRWEVSVGGNSQTCALLDDLWQDALFKRLPKDAKVKRILMLGLGTGSTLRSFYRRFPGCKITAIEWDPEMVRLMDRFMGFSLKERPEVHVGDVQEILPTLSGHFDLICSDLFEGKRVSPVTISDAYLENLRRLLNPYGFLLLNAFAQPEVIESWKASFVLMKSWQYHTNAVGLFCLSGAGVVGDRLPHGYERYMANRFYLEREFGTWSRYQVMHSGEATGVRQALGPGLVEFYRGDREPVLLSETRGRLVFWYPTTRLDRLKDWYRFPLQNDRRKTGFAVVEPGEFYWKSWSSQAQRHRADWFKQDRFVLVKPDFSEYAQAYARCHLDRDLVKSFTHSIERKMRSHAGLVRLYGIRDRQTGALVAGLTTLDIPEIQQSMHVTSFLLDEARKTPSGVALIEAWFSEGQARGVRFFEFDGFWAPGDPVSWKGYSQFKAQFNIHFIVYPKPLMRFVAARKA